MSERTILSDAVLDIIAPVNPTEVRLELEDIEKAERELIKEKGSTYTPLLITNEHE